MISFLGEYPSNLYVDLGSPTVPRGLNKSLSCLNKSYLTHDANVINEYLLWFANNLHIGFQPVSLMPPSMAEYQSQTLPLRGKQARRRHTETALMSRKLDALEVYVDDRAPRDHIRPMSTDSTHRINRSPQNTKLVHRSSMNYVISPKKTSPTSVTSGGLDETDGGDMALMDGVCSKTSVTSVSSTSMFTQSVSIIIYFSCVCIYNVMYN